MSDPTPLFVGLGVHKDSIAVAHAQGQCADPPVFVGAITVVAELGDRLSIFLPDLVQPCLGQIPGRHAWMERHAGVEMKEERFRDRWYLRRVGNIDHERPASLSVAFRKIRRLGFQVLQDLLDNLTCRSVLHEGVERLQWQLKIDEHTHVILLKMSYEPPRHNSRVPDPRSSSFGCLTAPVHQRRRASAQAAVNRATDRSCDPTPMPEVYPMVMRPSP